MAAQRPSRQSLVRAWLAVLLAWTPRLHAAATADHSLPGVCRYQFVAEREKLFNAESHSRECWVADDGRGGPEGKELGDLVIAQTGFMGYCLVLIQNADQDVLLELGRLEGCDGSTREAYRISPPRRILTQSRMSWSAIKLRAEVAENASLFWYEESRPGDGFETGEVGIAARHVLEEENTARHGFVRLNKMAEDLHVPTVLVVMKQGEEERLSTWPRIAATVEGARLAGGDEFGGYSITGRRFTLSAQDEESLRPHHPKIDFPHGPPMIWVSSGETKKEFLIVDRKDGLEGVVWRDQNTHHIFMTWLAADLRSSTTTRIDTGANNSNVLAIASDGHESLAILTYRGNDDPYTITEPLRIHLVDSFTGAIVRTGEIPVQDHDIWFAGGGPGGSMVWNVERNQLGVIFIFYHPRMADGHHQGAIMMTIDVDSLAPEDVRFYGASAHSFGNSMVLASNGDFLAADMGDNYPRGINAHRFTREFHHSKVVYYYRAQHGQDQRPDISNGAHVYEEISNENVTYYQWSNDNNLHTELAHAGIVEVDDGILYFFVGENPPLSHNPPPARNPGFVKIPKDLTDPTVLSPGEVETGGFYAYWGEFSLQENKGINFLTNYSLQNESGSRLKTARLGRNKIALFWERWGVHGYSVYTDQRWMVVDDDGQEVVAPFDPGYHPRLGMSDDLRIVGGRAVAYSGTQDGQLLRYEFCISDDCPGVTPLPPPPPPTPAGLTRGADVEVTCGPGGLYHPARVLNVSADGVVVAYELAGLTYYCTPKTWRLATGSDEDHCAPHGGILPSWGGRKCCPASCGVCGGDDCHAMPGGREHCCTRHIPEHRACGRHGARAPCTVAPSLPQSPSRRL